MCDGFIQTDFIGIITKQRQQNFRHAHLIIYLFHHNAIDTSRCQYEYKNKIWNEE